MVVIGTRPEATKMCTVIQELNRHNEEFETLLVLTGQHQEQLYQALDAFNLKPDIDLNIMRERQTLTYITSESLIKLGEVIEDKKPDMVLVHGDTQAALCGSLAAYFHKIPTGHVEAGLRTYNKYSPWPEEMNRRIADSISDLLFAPTSMSKDNLSKEGYLNEQIFVTGQTSVDAALDTYKDEHVFENSTLNQIDFAANKIITATVHRRENYGLPMKQIFSAMKRIVDEHQDVTLIYPIHKSPTVRDIAYPILKGHERIKLIEPLGYPDMINLLGRTHLIMSDSGGLQEETAVFGKPLILLRDTTERPEAVEANVVVLAGTEEENIYSLTNRLLTDNSLYNSMKNSENPFGDGKASKRIINILKKYFDFSESYPSEFISILDREPQISK